VLSSYTSTYFPFELTFIPLKVFLPVSASRMEALVSRGDKVFSLPFVVFLGLNEIDVTGPATFQS